MSILIRKARETDLPQAAAIYDRILDRQERGLTYVGSVSYTHLGAGVLQGVGGELIENLVVLGLLPLELHIIAGVDGLQILDEQGQGALAAAGVADVYKRQG